MGECSSMWYSNNIWDAGETDTFRNSPIFKNRFAGNLELLAEHWGITTAEAKARWTSLVVLTDKENVIKLLDNYPNVYLTYFYSSITGEKIPMDRKIIAKNSTEVCANAVDFPKMVKKMYAEGAGIFIEVGANATCTRWINTILTDQPHLAVATNQSGKTDARNLAGMMAQLLSHGVELIAFPYDDQPSDFANNKINTMIETTPTNKTGKSKPGTIGENGLKLQDYEAGDSVKGKKIIYSGGVWSV